MTDDLHRASLIDLAYVGDVTEGAACPFCKNATWAYAEGDDGRPASAAIHYARGSQTFMLPLVPLTCEKCGFIRFHDLAMVRSVRERGGNND